MQNNPEQMLNTSIDLSKTAMDLVRQAVDGNLGQELPNAQDILSVHGKIAEFISAVNPEGAPFINPSEILAQSNAIEAKEFLQQQLKKPLGPDHINTLEQLKIELENITHAHMINSFLDENESFNMANMPPEMLMAQQGGQQIGVMHPAAHLSQSQLNEQYAMDVMNQQQMAQLNQIPIDQAALMAQSYVPSELQSQTDVPMADQANVSGLIQQNSTEMTQEQSVFGFYLAIRLETDSTFSFFLRHRTQQANFANRNLHLDMFNGNKMVTNQVGEHMNMQMMQNDTFPAAHFQQQPHIPEGYMSVQQQLQQPQQMMKNDPVDNVINDDSIFLLLIKENKDSNSFFFLPSFSKI